jgi:hypothetical protein
MASVVCFSDSLIPPRRLFLTTPEVIPELGGLAGLTLGDCCHPSYRGTDRPNTKRYVTNRRPSVSELPLLAGDGTRGRWIRIGAWDKINRILVEVRKHQLYFDRRPDAADGKKESLDRPDQKEKTSPNK